MRKLSNIVTGLACLIAASSLLADWQDNDLTSTIPILNEQELTNFQKVPDVAQYKLADWNNVVGIAKGVSLEEAAKIANSNPEIAFFFYTKGGQMVLETDSGYRRFRNRDAVFFSGTPWWGSAEGLADGYVKNNP